ncbi:MAG: potassium channel family protein [Candidatus Micrarchaeota archaeon]
MTSIEEIKRNLVMSIILIIVIFAVGSIAYNYLEGWSLLDSIYFITMTVTTVGYGDIIPHTPEGKVFTIGLVWIGVSVAFFLIYSIAAYRESAFDRHVVNKLEMLRNITLIRRGPKKIEKNRSSIRPIRKMLGEM